MEVFNKFVSQKPNHLLGIFPAIETNQSNRLIDNTKKTRRASTGKIRRSQLELSGALARSFDYSHLAYCPSLQYRTYGHYKLHRNKRHNSAETTYEEKTCIYTKRARNQQPTLRLQIEMIKVSERRTESNTPKLHFHQPKLQTNFGEKFPSLHPFPTNVGEGWDCARTLTYQAPFDSHIAVGKCQRLGDSSCADTFKLHASKPHELTTHCGLHLHVALRGMGEGRNASPFESLLRNGTNGFLAIKHLSRI